GLEKLSLESVGWLLSVLVGDQESGSEVAAIRHLLNNRVTETAGAAHFVCSYSDGDYLVLNSDRRADGVILEGLIKAEPRSDLNLKPADYGFTVERSYEAVDDPADVSRGPDGAWRIKAGARVRVRLTMVATARRYHVALVDPLPAGFEALNPSLATTGNIP